MKLYHGSNVVVENPQLIPSKRLLDFGEGFYLTSDLEQARKWAIRSVNNYLKGYFSEEIAIQLLLPQKLKDQYAFKTEKALRILCFKEAINV